jgi:hypothetical protein
MNEEVEEVEGYTEIRFYPGQSHRGLVGMGRTLIIRDRAGKWDSVSLTWQDKNVVPTNHTLADVVLEWEKDHSEHRIFPENYTNTIQRELRNALMRCADKW